MNRGLPMPVAQNAPIGMGLLCPSDSVGNDAMDMGVVVDRKGFVSRSKEENAAAATLERAARSEIPTRGGHERHRRTTATQSSDHTRIIFLQPSYGREQSQGARVMATLAPFLLRN
jgi:hypothetical protein